MNDRQVTRRFADGLGRRGRRGQTRADKRNAQGLGDSRTHSQVDLRQLPQDHRTVGQEDALDAPLSGGFDEVTEHHVAVLAAVIAPRPLVQVPLQPLVRDGPPLLQRRDTSQSCSCTASSAAAPAGAHSRCRERSGHQRPITLAPRFLAPLIFSQPTLWLLRVFVPARFARIARGTSCCAQTHVAGCRSESGAANGIQCVVRPIALVTVEE